MNVTWLGHSCFHLKSSTGLSLLLDPFNEGEVGYAMPYVKADIVSVSHDHGDHNNIQSAGSNAYAVTKPGLHIVKGLTVRGIESYHDHEHGNLRGPNTIYCFVLDDIRVCHLGDLGHILSSSQINAIGQVDLLFLPVGGIYTIDAHEAESVMRSLNPIVTIPMHYKTRALNFDLGPLSYFLISKDYLGPLTHLELTKDDLPSRGIIALLSCPEAENGTGSID
jgi:L-ascorbate metabolism protein UlaG (beta-lactamase superfamily)